ncbi:hypothetical protein RhiirB3_447150 [Rhizophagus irregularis]|nr:hypothetical protein RhiirB3_447150 [Rhizophagus irregularis]
MVYNIKNKQDVFCKEIKEQLSGILEKVDQLMIPENSYWKNLALKTCKFQLPILGVYPDQAAF